MKPFMLEGGSAFSRFRLESLTRDLIATLPSLAGGTVDASWVYLLDLARPLEAEGFAHTCALLNAAAPSGRAGGFFVTPRKGTISPWSSKASDIFHNCGLTDVRRVERGLRFRLADATRTEIGLGALGRATDALYDRMTEGVYDDLGDFFDHRPPARGRVFDVLTRGLDALAEANRTMGLALSDDEMRYLADAYAQAGRNPTDTELVMFGQVNSEHCRHKIFNASWRIDGQPQTRSLFEMIKHTHACHPEGTLVAYKDNSSVVEGFEAEVFEIDPDDHAYRFTPDQVDLIMKVETHNHPTAISPFPGAATGVGGEIRDEAATGTGSKTKAGICGFMVSNLRVPGHEQPWEGVVAEHPRRLASPLDIMLEGPIGGAAFGNEFGRPQLTGFFRTYEEQVADRYLGYHKPIMIAGGMGSIRREHVQKKDVVPGARVAQLGGPALRIGLGGGAASSMATGSNDEALDFDSVQRGNAEMERRCQEVIDTCVAMGAANPILSIHDIGAGGLSNGCPELVEKTGAVFQLRAVPNEEPSMSPMEIWCCEAQERYVLAIGPDDQARFEEICRRERCPVAFIGTATGEGRLVLEDAHFGDRPIDMDLQVLLGKPPRMLRDVTHAPLRPAPLDLGGLTPAEALERVLHLPAVADKTFLITIADRTVTGLVHRDQMAGPFQVPVADCAVTTTGFRATTGEAMATGERTPIAVIDAPAAGRMAVGEALTNLVGAQVGGLGQVKLSANWMCACGEPGEDAKLYDTVAAVGLELCPTLGVSIPVGKDSLSMRTVWSDGADVAHRQTAPQSLIVSAFAPVTDVRATLTPDLKPGSSVLLLVDLGRGKNRLGGSALAQVVNQVGTEPPDLDDPQLFKAFFSAMQQLVAERRLLACHDRSDGGVAVTLLEMGLAGGRGFDVELGACSAVRKESAGDACGQHGPSAQPAENTTDRLLGCLPGGGPPDPQTEPHSAMRYGLLGGEPSSLLAPLFTEELGVVLQVADAERDVVLAILGRHGLADVTHVVGTPRDDARVRMVVGGRVALEVTLPDVRRSWSALTHQMQRLRDNPACATQEYEDACDPAAPGLAFHLTYDPDRGVATRPVPRPPRVAVLREQGVNGHVEMAAAFALAGFEAIDVHMTDLHAGRVDLADVAGLVACGGFSYGDVLGAGSGWARSILYNPRLADMFAAFFARPDTFTLGVCNGCQMVSQLKGIIPGAGHWPTFHRNVSEQFEARYATVEILPSPSILLAGMAGARVPIAVAHGEGLAVFDTPADRDALLAAGLASVRFVDGHGRPALRYPLNPNGSEGGLTGFTSTDGRATILMPHPERGFRAVQLSYRPADLFTGEAGPWMRMFQNAYAFACEAR